MLSLSIGDYVVISIIHVLGTSASILIVSWLCLNAIGSGSSRPAPAGPAALSTTDCHIAFEKTNGSGGVLTVPSSNNSDLTTTAALQTIAVLSGDGAKLTNDPKTTASAKAIAALSGKIAKLSDDRDLLRQDLDRLKSASSAQSDVTGSTLRDELPRSISLAREGAYKNHWSAVCALNTTAYNLNHELLDLCVAYGHDTAFEAAISDMDSSIKVLKAHIDDDVTEVHRGFH